MRIAKQTMFRNTLRQRLAHWLAGPDEPSEQLAAFVRDLYLAVLERTPARAELEAAVIALRSHTVDRRSYIESVAHSAEFHALHWNRRPAPAGCLQSEAEQLFRNFQRYEGPGRAGYVTNFLGGITSVSVIEGLSRSSGHVEGYPIPRNFRGDVLEWVGTLRAVLEATHRFTMIELGAGWAPWCVVGCLASKQRDIRDIHLIAVEGDEGHIRFARENFSANNVPESCVTLVHGIAQTEDGEALFPKAGNASKTYDGAATALQAYSTAPVGLDRLRSYRLETLARGHEPVDLIHCDIQGAEVSLFEQALPWASAAVRRIVIGTHSFAIDRALVTLFGRAGWQAEGINACVMREDAGPPVVISDGTQVWRNPSL
jgi:FkbM family methyltransferase